MKKILFVLSLSLVAQQMGLLGTKAFASGDVFTEIADQLTTTTAATPTPVATPTPIASQLPENDPIVGEDTVGGVEVPEVEDPRSCPRFSNLKFKAEIKKRQLKNLFGLLSMFSKNKGTGEISGKILECSPSDSRGLAVFSDTKSVAKVSLSAPYEDSSGMKVCNFKTKKFKLEARSALSGKNETVLNLVHSDRQCGEISRAFTWENKFFGKIR